MDVFKLDSLSYKYSDGNTYVIDNLNCKFEKGKSYALVGKSGTGKTTLLSLMAGLEKPTKGKILYNGKDIQDIDKDEYRSKDVGIIFQSFNLLPQLTALENVILSMDIAKVNNKKDGKTENGDKCSKTDKKSNYKEKYALELLNKVGIDSDKACRRILRLSGGEQQRVAIARTLSYNPMVIFADEPTGNLDKETEGQIIEIFNNLAKEDQKCVIIVTHSDRVAEAVDVVYDLKTKEARVNHKG